jgi:hypothetical protein
MRCFKSQWQLLSPATRWRTRKKRVAMGSSLQASVLIAKVVSGSGLRRDPTLLLFEGREVVEAAWCFVVPGGAGAVCTGRPGLLEVLFTFLILVMFEYLVDELVQEVEGYPDRLL